MKRAWDVVVIGAGLSGLSAASRLGERCLVLEAEDRPGGRVHTVSIGGVTAELGAYFAFHERWLPDLVAEPAHPGVGVAAVLDRRGQLHRGSSFLDAATTALPTGADALRAYAEERLAWEALRPEERELLSGGFALIHPGDPDAYDEVRRRDATRRFPCLHREGGNAQLVDALARPLGDRLRLGAEVTEIETSASGLRISWRKAGRHRTISTDALVLAVPAPVAAKLLIRAAPKLARRARRYTFASGASLAVVVGQRCVAPLDYIVNLGEGPRVLLARDQGCVRVWTALFPAADGRLVPSCAEEALAATLPVLAQIGEPSLDTAPHAFRHWPSLGVVIGPATHAEPFPGGLSQGPIFLAGDWTNDPNEVIPFGMRAALRSGIRTGDRVRHQLAARVAEVP